MGSIVPQPGDVRSFWLQEALAADPGAPCPPLRRRVRADVCIVGGGFAGLWTAHELLDREPGLRIALLEADICGGGASGRNGGFFSSSWHDLLVLCQLYGEEPGLRYASALADQVGAVGAWCSPNRVDAWFHHEGVLGMETNPEQLGAHEEALGLSRRLGMDVMEPLEPAEVRRYADSSVAVRADHVVFTIGAWATGWRGFRTRLGNLADYVVATEPIPDRLEEIGWTSNVGIADARDMLYYLRPTDDRRIAIGGGSTGVPYGGTIGRGATRLRSVAEVAARGLFYLFPQLEGVRFTHPWGGPIDMSASWTPFFRTLEPGNVHCGLGFSGHGLAATKLGGKTLASMVLGVQDEWTELPVVGDVLARTPPEPLRWPLVRSAV